MQVEKESNDLAQRTMAQLKVSLNWYEDYMGSLVEMYREEGSSEGDQQQAEGKENALQEVKRAVTDDAKPVVERHALLQVRCPQRFLWRVCPSLWGVSKAVCPSSGDNCWLVTYRTLMHVDMVRRHDVYAAHVLEDDTRAARGDVKRACQHPTSCSVVGAATV